jgi:Flp pilus assembly protein TadB
MPVVWGIPASKVFAGVWIIVLVGALAIIQFYVLQLGWWLSSFYSFFVVILPLVFILKRLYEAQTTRQYHQLSSAVKLVMLAGILSMFFLRLV